MPGSIRENDEFVIHMVTNVIRPKSILDVGAGSGTYADLLAPHIDCTIDAVEVWEPYIKRFNLLDKYGKIYQTDVRKMLVLDYDLVIFGDVLEHMTLEEAKFVWNDFTAPWAGWGMISVPIIHYPQGPEEGNPYEEHVQDHLSIEDIVEHFGPFDHMEKYDVTATFFRRFV